MVMTPTPSETGGVFVCPGAVELSLTDWPVHGGDEVCPGAHEGVPVSSAKAATASTKTNMKDRLKLFRCFIFAP
jgi:hypothetical protein